ncbi:ubiquinol oxidase subunit II [Chenggangzhangella methanolivorans]|uniref:Ubiquinol oxidase polypeptide II n=1 Tax=Chenggangzhangella methanolivorans TaxID=1437009 RepID=A0A9E6R579_9HYPH|nr:ubiquinol oxidase subunit II [Chenggangzhangella methanolivorans]QZN98417.1 ubiquinol oxidase subunit II [Chenggangzhangella methanolivorans]
MGPPVRAFKLLALLPLSLLLAGCEMVVMNPSGDIAVRQRDLILVSTALMLLIIIPVIALTLLFAWRYRASNKEAKYDPDWHHSTSLEVVIWAAPLVIIIALGAITWVSTHLLDPYRPLERLDANRAIPENVKPLEVQAVALDWKWLFFYPEYGVATVNELAAPVDRPITFKLTSSTVMNSFYVPALAGMIYAMPGMETKLHAVINKAGDYEGFSANYSGAGFSNMRFRFHGLDDAGFDAWIAKAKEANATLDRAGYTELEQPSIADPVKRWSAVEDGLYDAVLNRCVDRAKMCVKDMMAADKRGGGGREGVNNVIAFEQTRPDGTTAKKRFVSAVSCTTDAPRDGLTVEAPLPAPLGRRADASSTTAVAFARAEDTSERPSARSPE